MFQTLLNVIYYIADICYLACSCLYKFAFTSLAKLLQPDIYGATTFSSVAPFRGTTWEFALNNSKSSLFEEALATLMNWLNVPASTTLFEAVFFVICSGVVILFVVRIVVAMLKPLT